LRILFDMLKRNINQRKIKKLKIIIVVLIAIIIIILISLSCLKYNSHRHGYKYGHGNKNFLMKMDINSDGVFSKEEFLSRFEIYFKKLDTNNDDSLSFREIKKMRKLFKRYKKSQW